MKTFPKFLCAFAVLAALGLAFPKGALAQSNAGTDDASQSAYSGGWTNGSNGASSGNAFLAWNLASTSGSGSAGFFIGDSTTLGSPGANINVNGDSWGMYANGDPSSIATAQRMFTSDGSTVSALGVGQTFSIDIALNYTNGNKGIDLIDASSNPLFDLNIGSGTYAVNNAATGDGELANQTYDQDTAFDLSFSQTSLSGGTWSITRTGGQTDFDSGTYTGDAAGFKLYNQDTDTGEGPSNDYNNLFANDAAVTAAAAVPEPGTLFLGAIGLGALALRVGRRRGLA